RQPRNNRGGAPKGNTNALKDGRHSDRTRFSQWRGISASRPELADTEAACEALLAQLEAAVVDARGAMTLEDASAADVAVGALFTQRLAMCRLTMPGAMPADVELSLAKDALTAQQVRHKFIVALRLPKAGSNGTAFDPDAFYRGLAAQHAAARNQPETDHPNIVHGLPDASAGLVERRSEGASP
ncbi:MAG: hypothetical protein ACM3U2_07010, partial [Deltaproteobacteria bacterium]